MHSDHFLIFNMHGNRDSGLDFGRLSLNSLTGGTLHIWQATSSTESKQALNRFHEKGGPIPPQYRVPGLKRWEVHTVPIPMPGVKGVEGNFYKIDPHLVTTDNGGKRGDFGIHLDANAPGSLGCIVLSQARFGDFENAMKKMVVSGIAKLPLFVFYS